MEALKDVLPSHIFSILIQSSIDSMKVLMLKSSEEISDLTGLSVKDIDKIKEEAAEIILKNKICTAFETKPWARISTGCPSIDAITRGGIPINGINELSGHGGVGKTQFCLQLSLMVQLPQNLGGLGKSTLYISTKRAFPTNRLKQLAQFFPMRFPELTYNIPFEDNTFIEHITDYEQLHSLFFNGIESRLSLCNVGLIIIDSIAEVFRSYNEATNYLTRSKDFVTIANKLRQISDEHKICILCINQMTDNIETNRSEPALGLTWSNLVTCRFQISKSSIFNSNSSRQFKINFAPDLDSNKTAQFIISSNGLCSID